MASRGGMVLVIWLLGWVVMTPSTRAAPSAQAPSGFELTVAPIGNASATLRWTALGEAASYSVYGAWTALDAKWAFEAVAPGDWQKANPLALTPPGTWVSVAEAIRDSTLTVADLPPNQSFLFLVRAVDANGQEYAQSTATPVTLAMVPGTTLDVKMPTLTTARLAWAPVPGAARYTLLAAPLGRPLAPDRARTALETTATVIEGLPPGRTWRFAVLAQDADGHVLARTLTEEVTTTPAMPPGVGGRAGGPPGQPMMGSGVSASPWPPAPWPARFWR